MAIDAERENERRMDKVYDRIVASISMKPRAIKKYAFRALSWVGYATRTLAIQELLVAISVEPKQYQLNDSDMFRFEDLLDICNGLVIADGQDVRLVHFSVRNYLDRKQVIPEDTREMYRAIACSTYLSFDVFREQQWDRHALDVFQGYAASNLAFHLSKVERRHDTDTTNAVMKLLEDEGHMCAYCNANDEFAKPLEIPCLHLACTIGYEDAVRTLLNDSGMDVNADDPTYRQRPLSWAVLMGHEAVVKQLLDGDGVDPDCEGKEGKRPLALAIRLKRTGIVRLLLQKGVEVNFTFREVSQSDYSTDSGILGPGQHTNPNPYYLVRVSLNPLSTKERRVVNIDWLANTLL